MSKKSDSAISASMASRRPMAVLRAEMASTPFGQLSAESRDATLIPIDLIDPSPYQRRGTLDSEHVDNLAAMIKEQGLVTPIVVRRLPGGRFEHVTGHTRTEAFRRLGRSEIPAIIRDMSDRESALALTADNTLHKSLTDWQIHQHIRMLQDNGFEEGATELARVLGCSRSQFYRYADFGLLPKDVHTMLDEVPDLIGSNVASRLKEYCTSHPDLVVQAAAMVKGNKLNQDGMVSWLKRKTQNRVFVEPFKKELLTADKTIKVRLVCKEEETRITGQLDAAKLAALIEANLESLVLRTDVE